jgi:hypothetical protein
MNSDYIAFAAQSCIASGDLSTVARKTKQLIDQGETAPVLIFDSTTSRIVELDFRGSPEEVLSRLTLPETPELEKRGRGRPKLGVIPREVTLLPRHWEWLNDQPGGASVALRKLVEEARRTSTTKDKTRSAQEAVYRFMSAMAGNLPNYEEALRAFYANKFDLFHDFIKDWPPDIRDHIQHLVATTL